MIINECRQSLLTRQLTFGTWMAGGASSSAEILAHTGFDWIVIDCEHSTHDLETVTALLRAMHNRGVTPLVRVSTNDTLLIRRVLDAGAHGVVVPLICNADEAKRAVAATKYPPEGVRGYGYSRMNEWGIEFDQYAASANDNIAVVVMIETKEGVENADDIIAVDGVDGVIIGPYDLSGSYGVPGATDDPMVRIACKKVSDICRDQGKSAGIHVVHPNKETISQFVDDGFTFIAVGADIVYLTQGARGALNVVKSIEKKSIPPLLIKK